MKIKLCIILIFSTFSLFADIVPIEKARKIALQTISEKWEKTKFSNSIKEEIVITYDSLPTLYIFNVEKDNGFIVISAESNIIELLGYSLKGNYSSKNIPDALRELLNQYSYEINSNRYIYKTNNKTVNNNKNNNFVSPLLTTKWDQSCYYNDSCPAAPNAGAYYCNHVPAGCVAICLAQIIKFHQYPNNGIGSFSYYSPYYGTLTANFANTTYDYQSMPDILLSPNPATAQLIYHCGVAVHMDYKPQYSGAGITEARNALVNYFGYANSAQIIQKNSYSDANWKALIKSEIDSARPVFYSGYNQNNIGGHAFICDGYQTNDYFHFNWGWGGQFDGYFQLNALIPNSNNFSFNQSAIIGIKPQNTIPVAHFTANQTLISTGGNVNFTDISSGNPTNWNWTFAGGNPSTSNIKNPQNITYNAPGIYQVSLSVSNANGSNSVTKNQYITVAPIADFKANKTVISAGEGINFTDISTVISQPTSRLWTFAGATPSTSTNANPTNILYSQAGTYKVSLSITTAEGNHTITKNNYITVYSNCTYQFYDSIPKYYINPVNSANFQIKQEDFDSLTPYYAGHTSKWNIFNKINSPGDTNFFYGATSFFTQAGQANNWLEIGPITIPVNGAILKWDHLYYLNTKRDAYEVLISTSGITKEYYTAPPVFSRYDNDPLTNNDTIWKTQNVIIDPNIYGGQQIYVAFHHFANNKYYLFLDNIKIVSCTGLPVVADFTADSTNINTGGSVNFQDNSTGNPTSWKWTFYGGTPSTSNVQNPSGIIYNINGYHSVKLVVNNGFETDSIIKTNFIFSNNTSTFANNLIEELEIFPNPANEFIIIRLKFTNQEKMNLKIFDLLGNIVQATTIETNQKQIRVALNQLKKGLYIIELKTKEKTIFNKFIKSE